MSIIDYDELECKYCGHLGLLPDGGYDVCCPSCGQEYSLDNSENESDEDEEK